MSVYEKIMIAVATINFVAVLVGLYLANKRLQILAHVHQENHDWNRRIATQNATIDIAKMNFDELNNHINFMNDRHPLEVEKIRAVFLEKPELQLQCFKLLNVYEGMARGINTCVYDEGVVKAARKSAMLRTFNSFKAYIDFRRNETGRFTLWRDYENLVMKWTNEDFASMTKEATGGKVD